MKTVKMVICKRMNNFSCIGKYDESFINKYTNAANTGINIG
jgi:hypothetical protein